MSNVQMQTVNINTHPNDYVIFLFYSHLLQTLLAAWTLNLSNVLK